MFTMLHLSRNFPQMPALARQLVAHYSSSLLPSTRPLLHPSRNYLQVTSNFKRGQDVYETRQEGYTLHLGPGLESIGVSRVAVYNKEGLMVKRRKNLEGGNVCTLWLQVGLPNRPATLYIFGYRQWQLPNQDNITLSLESGSGFNEVPASDNTSEWARNPS